MGKRMTYRDLRQELNKLSEAELNKEVKLKLDDNSEFILNEFTETNLVVYETQTVVEINQD